MMAEAFAASPASVVVRELRYDVDRSGFRTESVTLVTTLVDAEKYPASSASALKRRRWEIEGHLRDLKQTLGLDELKCRTVSGARKELTALAMVYNLVRAVMVEAARRQAVAVGRISFVAALRWLALMEPSRGLAWSVVNPRRAERSEPRVRKRRPKSYKLMTKPRSELEKQINEQKDAA